MSMLKLQKTTLGPTKENFSIPSARDAVYYPNPPGLPSFSPLSRFPTPPCCWPRPRAPPAAFSSSSAGRAPLLASGSAGRTPPTAAWRIGAPAGRWHWAASSRPACAACCSRSAAGCSGGISRSGTLSEAIPCRHFICELLRVQHPAAKRRDELTQCAGGGR